MKNSYLKDKENQKAVNKQLQIKSNEQSNKKYTNENQKALIELSSSNISNSKTYENYKSTQKQLQKIEENKSMLFKDQNGLKNQNQDFINKNLSNRSREHLSTSLIKNQSINQSAISNFSQIKYQDPTLIDYFSKFDKKNEFSQKIDDYQNVIMKNLKNQLSIGKLKIQNVKPFPLKIKFKSQKQEQDEMRQKLQIKRQQALQKIKQIQQQEFNLKRRAISHVDKQNKRSSSIQILSRPQQQQKNQLTKAIKEYRKFTKQVQERQSMIQQQTQQKHLLQLQKQQQLFRLRRQSRQQQIKNNLKQIMQRQRIRKSIIDEWKTKQKQIKNKKYLYIQYKQKDRKQEMIQEMEVQKTLDRIRKNHAFDKDDLVKHQKKYQELLQQRKQLFRSMSLSHVTHNSQFKKYQLTKFHKLALKQLQDIKRKQIQKSMKVKQNQFKQKILKYQQKIDNQIKPTLHFKKFVPLPRCMSMDSLAPQQHRKIGLNYLQKAKKLKKPVDQLKLSQLKKQSQQRLKQSKFKNSYKDYLQQIKKDLKYDPSQRRFDEILNKKRVNSDFERLKDAKYLSEYLVQKRKGNQEEKTMLSIKNKMSILNSIY